MKKNRISILLIVAIFVFLVVGGQLTTAKINSKGESDAITYKIGYLPITHALPVFEEKELLEKENKGIRIELQKFSSWSDLTDALHAGKIDGASELIELAMSAKAKGIDLKAVALGHRDGNVIVVNEKIKTAQDMKGKVFAIPSTQSSHYILLLEELKKAGLSLNDVSITQLAPAEMPASLASGAIDGYCVAEPFGALDAITRMKLQDDILNICHETKKTIVFVTHDIEEAIFLADRVVIMDANPGRIKAVVNISLGNNRDRTSEDFLLIRDKIFELFHMKKEVMIEYYI